MRANHPKKARHFFYRFSTGYRCVLYQIHCQVQINHPKHPKPAAKVYKNLGVSMARLSGMQKDVLALYRRVLRAAAAKDRQTDKDTTFVRLLFHPSTTIRYAKAEFRRQSESTKKSDFKKIEYMIRKGDKHIKLLGMPGVKAVLA